MVFSLFRASFFGFLIGIQCFLYYYFEIWWNFCGNIGENLWKFGRNLVENLRNFIIFLGIVFVCFLLFFLLWKIEFLLLSFDSLMNREPSLPPWRMLSFLDFWMITVVIIFWFGHFLLGFYEYRIDFVSPVCGCLGDSRNWLCVSCFFWCLCDSRNRHNIMSWLCVSCSFLLKIIVVKTVGWLGVFLNSCLILKSGLLCVSWILYFWPVLGELKR